MLDKIREIIIEQLNLQEVEITEDTSFKDDLGADSLDLFELVSGPVLRLRELFYLCVDFDFP